MASTASEKSWVEVFLGAGSNLEQPRVQLKRALSALQLLPGCKEVCCSPVYLSSPMGPQQQPDYLNAVIRMATWLTPRRLLGELQAIEQAQGRTREERWGPRTLDLDLLLYGDLVLDTVELKIPHPGIAARAFVLYPLRDIAPDLIIPGLGSLAKLISQVDASSLVRLDDSR